MRATYTGPECKKCGNAERYLPRKNKREKTGACVACKLQKSAEWRKDKPEKQAAATKRWREEHPERVRELARNRERDPIKKNARQLIANRVHRGLLDRIDTLVCRRCSNQAVDYHHPDYDTPWLVIPLCRDCHQEEHSA